MCLATQSCVGHRSQQPVSQCDRMVCIVGAMDVATGALRGGGVKLLMQLNAHAQQS